MNIDAFALKCSLSLLNRISAGIELTPGTSLIYTRLLLALHLAGIVFSVKNHQTHSVMANHQSTELNNVNETWNQNERLGSNTGEPATVGKDLADAIKEEAAEYDNSNKEERTLGGERASVRDDEDSAGT